MQRSEENALRAGARGDRFKAARVHMGVTQAMMAQLIGCTPNTWQNYESGATMPGGAQLEALARLNFSVNWLLTGEGAMLTADERAAPSTPAEPAAAAPLDEDLMAAIADGIARVYKEEGARLPEGDKGRLIARIHNDLVAAYDDPDGRRHGLPMALQQLRRTLRAAPATDQGKRLA